jgi:hypothetical protein
MNTTTNKKIAFAALAAPVLAAVAVGLAAPAWAGSEQVEPSEASEVSEVGLPTMPREQQEQANSLPQVAVVPHMNFGGQHDH